MLNADYFKSDFRKQLSELGDSAAAACLVLRNGMEYAVHRIFSIEEHYLLAQVYPRECDPRDPDSVQRCHNARRGIQGNVLHDHIAIGYEEISHIILTTKLPDGKKELGFLRQ